MRPDKILISRPDRIGDVILSTPCLKPLRQKYPNAVIYFLVQKHLIPILNGIEFIDEVIALPDHDQVNVLSKMMVERKIDTVVHLHPNKVVEESAWKAQVR